MTREEAIDIIKCLAWHTRPNEEDVEQAIKALEPCEDCISREAVLNLPRIKTHNEWGNVIKESVDVEDVRQLPSVNPQEPKADIALERYKDLQDYFSDKDIAKAILSNQAEFKAWLERLRWNTRKVDELARKLEALEQEPCEDAISRQAVNEIINDIRDCISVEGYWAFLERLKKLPSVNPQPKTGWIPVTERLPEDEQEVLVSCKNGCVSLDTFNKDNLDCDYFDGGEIEDIDAWMPLPEPYKAESEESE